MEENITYWAAEHLHGHCIISFKTDICLTTVEFKLTGKTQAAGSFVMHMSSLPIKKLLKKSKPE